MNSKLMDWISSQDPLLKLITSNTLGKNKAIIADNRIKTILDELTDWPGTVLNSHKSANQPFHKLFFLADLGITGEDIPEIIQKVLTHVSEEGPFTLPMNISTRYGGNGEDTWAWALCDAPTITYSLIKMGLKDNDLVKKSIKYLVSLIDENGYHCKVSNKLGWFRGPGKKNDPCPYATLIMLRLLNELDGYEKEKDICNKCLLKLWERSKEEHPYMFYMGNDFRKLKAPLFWYDLLNVVDVLSRNSKIVKDSRFIEMLKEIEKKVDQDGKYKAESIYRSWREWDFNQKKEPSGWITYYVVRIKDRLQRQNGF